MFTSARSAQVAVNGDTMNYLVFGKGPKTLVILPGLGDGLTQVLLLTGCRERRGRDCARTFSE